MRRLSLLKSKLFAHQIKHVKFHAVKRKSGDWSECGTGKSLTALAKFRLLYHAKVATKLLIVCPLSVLESWALEIEKHTDFTYVKLIGDVDSKLRLLKQDKHIYLITYDAIAGRGGSLGIVWNALIRKKFGMVVCDEITNIKNFRARRTKALALLCEKIQYSVFLSGTPITKHVEDIFTIYRIMDDGDTFGKNIFSAKHTYLKNIGYIYPNWVIRQEKLEELRDKLYKNAVRVKKDECLDLPPKIWLPRFCYLSQEQQELYRDIANNILEDLEVGTSGKTMSIHGALDKMGKLSQIIDGFVYANEGTQLLAQNPKLEVLREVIQEIPQEEKIIIYARWREDLRLIGTFLQASGIPFSIMHGNLSAKQRKEQILSFIQKKEVRVFLSQIETGGFGLTLIQASNIIYFSLSFSLVFFLQSQDRIHRIGQTKSCRYFILMGKDSIDEYVWETLQKGIELSKALIDKNRIIRLKEYLTKIGEN